MSDYPRSLSPKALSGTHTLTSQGSFVEVSLETDLTLGEQHLAIWSGRLKEPSFVYVIRGDPGTPVKIGVTTCITSRTASMQTGNYQQLRLLYVLPGTGDLEVHLHKMLRTCRVQGEWFKMEKGHGFWRYIEELCVQMVDAYSPGSQVAPDWRMVDRVKFGKVRRPKEAAPVTVRFVQPDPKVDPEEAQRIRASVPKAAFMGSCHPIGRKRISPHPDYN